MKKINKINKMFISFLLSCGAICLSINLFAKNYHSSSADNEYSIVFNEESKFNESGTFTDGNQKIKTKNNNLVDFSYFQLRNITESYWQQIDMKQSDTGGYFFNTTRINAITSLEINFAYHEKDLSFTIEWSNYANFSSKKSHSFIVIGNKEYTVNFDFDMESPNYFKFVNTCDKIIEIRDMTLRFACKLKYPTVEITSGNNGTVTSSIPNGPTIEGTKFLITATSNNNFTFDGWYDPHTNKRYSTDLVLELTVMNEDIYLEARYKEVTDNKFQVFTFVKGNGKASGGGFYSPSEKVTLTSSPNDGYFSLGWFDVENYQSEEMKNLIYTFEMPSNDLCFITKFGKPYNINYSPSPTVGGSISGPTTAIEGQEVTLTATPNFNNEYAFNCWKDENGEEITQENPYTFTMPNYDLNLVVDFIKGIKLTVVSSNPDYGTVTGDGYYLEGRNVTINATCKNDNFFLGWYDSNQYLGCLSLNNTYQYTMGSTASTLYAKFLSASEYQAWVSSHGGTPSNITETSLTYGLYPQSHVNDTMLITELERYAPKANEEYFIYDNEYYVKDTGEPFDYNYTFSDGTIVEWSKTYYFKCEPITWNIISSNNGTYFLDCSNILNALGFDNNSSNNYKDSDIRAWLNKDFYDQAFFLNNSFIQVTTVDNSAKTTDKDPNPWACEETKDKIYLRSYQDWGKAGQSSRIKKVSDFSICNYAYLITSGDNCRNGAYWTRSPYSNDFGSSWYVSYDGSLGHDFVGNHIIGSSPTLTITI